LALYGAAAYYNQTLFDEAGLEYPSDDWTWDQYRDAASQLTKDADGNRPSDANFNPENIVVYGANHWNWNYMYSQMAWEKGVDIMTPDSSACAMRDPAWVEVFQWVDAAVNEYFAHPGGVMAPTGESGGVAFNAGTVAIDFGMNWSLASYIRDIADFEWAMAAMPSLEGTRIPVALNDGIVAFTDGKHHEETWTFIKYFESEDVSRNYILKEVAPPFKKVCLEEYLASVSAKNSNALQISLETGRPMPYDRAWDDWQGIMDQALGGFLIREMFESAEEATDWAATEIDKVRASVWAV
jgi:multiple sugar transport system substrate-binding protein